MTSFSQAKEVKSDADGPDEPRTSHRSNYGQSSVAFDLERRSRVEDKARTTISDQPSTYLPGTSRNFSSGQPMNSEYSPRGTLAVDETRTSTTGQSRFSSYAGSRATTSGQLRPSDYYPRGTSAVDEMRTSGQVQPSSYVASQADTSGQLRPSDYYTRGTSAVDEMRTSGQVQPSPYDESRTTTSGQLRTSDYSPRRTTAVEEMRTSGQSRPSYADSRTTSSGQPMTSDYGATRSIAGDQTRTSTFVQPRTSSPADTRAVSSSQRRTTTSGPPQEMENIDTQDNLEQVSRGALSGDGRRSDSRGRQRSKDGQSSVSFVLENKRESQVEQTAKASTSEQPNTSTSGLARTSSSGKPTVSDIDQPESSASGQMKMSTSRQTEDKRTSSTAERLSSSSGSTETEIVQKLTDEGQETTERVISTEEQSRDNELAVNQCPPVNKAAVDYMASEKETQRTRFHRANEKRPPAVGCPTGRVLPCKRFGKVFRDTQKCFDDMRGESDERFSCWNLVKNGASKSFNCTNPSKDFTVGWRRETDHKYATISTENNAKLSCSDCFSECDAFPVFHVECPIHSFGPEKAGDACPTERLTREEPDNFGRLLELTFACSNDDDDGFACNSFNSCAYSQDGDRYNRCFDDNCAKKYR